MDEINDLFNFDIDEISTIDIDIVDKPYVDDGTWFYKKEIPVRETKTGHISDDCYGGEKRCDILIGIIVNNNISNIDLFIDDELIGLYDCTREKKHIREYKMEKINNIDTSYTTPVLSKQYSSDIIFMTNERVDKFKNRLAKSKKQFTKYFPAFLMTYNSYSFCVDTKTSDKLENITLIYKPLKKKEREKFIDHYYGKKNRKSSKNILYWTPDTTTNIIKINPFGCKVIEKDESYISKFYN